MLWVSNVYSFSGRPDGYVCIGRTAAPFTATRLFCREIPVGPIPQVDQGNGKNQKNEDFLHKRCMMYYV